MTAVSTFFEPRV